MGGSPGQIEHRREPARASPTKKNGEPQRRHTTALMDLKSGVFLGFVVYRKNRLASCDVIATPHCAVCAQTLVGALWSLACVRSTG